MSEASALSPQPSDDLSNSGVESAYRARTPGSAARAQEAQSLFPSGIVHDSRRLKPYPIYVDRAKGARKWDVDGNEYIDFYGGHGALILGHGHPQVLEAVHQQLDRGTHFAACHDLEMEWAQKVKSLVPCADRVRFTSSGTEANLMALRLARAYTGRDKIVRFRGHFHGWQDHVAFGVDSHFDGTPSVGVVPGIADHIILADSQDVEGTVALLQSRDDIAAVILEPTGGSFGLVPLPENMRSELRRVTAERGIVLIFDEVVTGFRVSSGGAQDFYGITPDMATFAKIVAGGLPGGCVSGRKDILDHLDFDVSMSKGREKVGHQGTYNANPVCAASGIAALDLLVELDACKVASERAQSLRDQLNEMFDAQKLPWMCYGDHSAFYIHKDPNNDLEAARAMDMSGMTVEAIKQSGKHDYVRKLRLAMLVEGVDMSSKPGGLTSAIHSEEEISQTVAATERAFARLRQAGEL